MKAIVLLLATVFLFAPIATTATKGPGYQATLQDLAKGFSGPQLQLSPEKIKKHLDATYVWPEEFTAAIDADNCPVFDGHNLGWLNVDMYTELANVFGLPAPGEASAIFKIWPKQLVRCLSLHCSAGHTDLVCHYIQTAMDEVRGQELERRNRDAKEEKEMPTIVPPVASTH